MSDHQVITTFYKQDPTGPWPASQPRIDIEGTVYELTAPSHLTIQHNADGWRASCDGRTVFSFADVLANGWLTAEVTDE